MSHHARLSSSAHWNTKKIPYINSDEEYYYCGSCSLLIKRTSNKQMWHGKVIDELQNGHTHKRHALCRWLFRKIAKHPNHTEVDFDNIKYQYSSENAYIASKFKCSNGKLSLFWNSLQPEQQVTRWFSEDTSNLFYIIGHSDAWIKTMALWISPLKS